ncbi:DMT family transporter [Marivibrio halodurans]|uniref:DMT family transporter n=1 Tax=Marivibrio halodurans TaxID=2039722 RepID=A0A8J7S2U8_9PROT|nr:DMT family transporter [Marivibrio halodurans]MBP5857563.1 DMT family transporter [Marivibrio halodurans]
MTETAPPKPLPPSPPGDDPRATLKGVALMCLAVFLFIMLEMTAKASAEYMPVAQTVWARYFSHLALMTLFLAPRYGMRLIATRRPGLQIVRSLLLLLITGCTFFSLRHLQMAEVTTIGFAAPFFVAALSVPLLGEKVGVHRWSAIALGFIGVAIAMRPGLGVFHWAALVVLGAALANAFYLIATRKAKDEDPVVSIYFTSFAGALVMSAVVPFFWVTPSEPIGWVIMVALGIFGGLGHFMLILGHTMAPASLLAPFYYTQLAFSVGVGYAVFGDVPDGFTIAGALIVLASGLYLIYRERKKARA